MSSSLRHFPSYLAVVAACYATAWFIACIVVNGDLGFSTEYFRLFWTGAGGERPVFTGIISIVLTLPSSLAAIWLLRRSLKKKDEKEPNQTPEPTAPSGRGSS